MFLCYNIYMHKNLAIKEDTVMIFLISILFLTLFVAFVHFLPKFDKAYNQEKLATNTWRELSEKEKEEFINRVKLNFPEDVNEEILSETIKLRKRKQD